MVHVYYHYNNGISHRGARCKSFATMADANRWIYWMGRNYPKFQLDEVFDK